MGLYDDSVVVDATVPIAPFAVGGLSCDPEALHAIYANAGITLAVLTLADDFPNSIEQTVKLIACNRQYFLSRPDRFLLADGVDQVRRAKMDRRVAVAFAFQGTNALLGELALVEVYRRLGIIQMLLAYNAGNFAADGCHERRNAGLTEYGRCLVAEMNRVGVIVDLSHTGARSSLEALELTTRPPVFSHSTPRKFGFHDRNITDEQIVACAARDGVVCVTGVGLFMDGEHGKASVQRLADTIEHVAQLVGARHAGIGLDYVIDQEALARYLRTNASLYGDGRQYPADGVVEFTPPCELAAVADELIRRGFSETDVRGILGENYLRVLAANCAS